jgi:hypothetical protein
MPHPIFWGFNIFFSALARDLCRRASCTSEKGTRFSESNPTQKKHVMKSFRLDKSLFFFTSTLPPEQKKNNKAVNQLFFGWKRQFFTTF